MAARGQSLSLTAALGCALALLAGPTIAQTALEYSVKANYLVRFAAFVEWPARAFSGADAPVVICVAGRDPFGATLERAALGQTAHGRSMIIRRPASREAVAGCHILYVGSGAETLITAAADQPGLLMVTDAAATTGRGAIHFVISGGRVRFHIDQRAAARCGLSVSSRLLNLALSVRAN